jgi:hypothetical protein
MCLGELLQKQILKILLKTFDWNIRNEVKDKTAKKEITP